MILTLFLSMSAKMIQCTSTSRLVLLGTAIWATFFEVSIYCNLAEKLIPKTKEMRKDFHVQL